MDSAIAARMRDEIVGTEVGGWRAIEFLGAGKSALVLKAEKAGQLAALKIFDPDLIKKYGFKPVPGDYMSETDVVRHDPTKVSAMLMRVLDRGRPR